MSGKWSDEWFKFSKVSEKVFFFILSGPDVFRNFEIRKMQIFRKIVKTENLIGYFGYFWGSFRVLWGNLWFESEWILKI